MTTAERKIEFIKAQVAAGRIVYLQTALRITKISAKHLPLVRARGENLEVMHGKKGWLNYNFAKLSAE